MTEVKYTNNSKQFMDALKDRKPVVLKAMGLEAERFAKKDKNMPVDTGRARNSITFAVAGGSANTPNYTTDDGDPGKPYSGIAPGEKGGAVYIGSNVDYFQYIETGGANMTPRHVLRNAVVNHKDRYQELMEMGMKGNE